MKNNLLVTKADFKKALTKLATKKDLVSLEQKLSQKIGSLDMKIDSVEQRLNNKIDDTEKIIRAGSQLDFEDFRQEINEKLNLLPTKEEFFSRMDKVMGELQTTRDEQILLSAKSSNHEDRIEVLEQKTGIVTV